MCALNQLDRLDDRAGDPERYLGLQSNAMIDDRRARHRPQPKPEPEPELRTLVAQLPARAVLKWGHGTDFRIVARACGRIAGPWTRG